jgi:competence protein ComGC
MGLMLRVLVMAVAILLALTIPQRTAYQEQLAEKGLWSWPTR